MTSAARKAVVVALTWIAALSLAGAAAYVVLISRALRPVADDYLIAVRVASEGPFRAVEHFWSTWIGDVFAWTLNVAFVGVPLAHLPIWLGSAVPFLTAVVAVSAAGVVLVRGAAELPGSPWALLGPLSLSLPTLWWAYFWGGPAFLDPTELSANLAAGITMWQTLNGQYVIPIALLVTGWLFLGSFERISQPLRLILFSGLGLLIGFTGVVVAVTFITFIPLVVIGRLVARVQIGRLDLYTWMAATAGALVGAVSSHRSPGSARRMNLLPEPSLNLDFTRAALRSVPRAVTEWGEGLWSPGALVVLTVTGALGLLFALRGGRTHASRLGSFGIALLAMSMTASIWNRLSEAFSYEAFWHVVQVREITWLGLVALGFTVGALAARTCIAVLVVPGVLFAGAVGVLLALSAIATMTDGVLVRYQQWTEGPAPFAGIGDIETDWVAEAWQDLADYRGLPER